MAGDLADRLAKLCRSSGGIPVKHLNKIFPEELRFQSAACLQGVRDAGSSGCPEGRADVEVIILRKKRTVNAVDDVLVMIPPVMENLLPGDLRDLLSFFNSVNANWREAMNDSM